MRLLSPLSVSKKYNPDARLKTESWPLTLNFRLGLAMDMMSAMKHSFIRSNDNRFTFAIDGNHPNDNNERINIGGEYAWKERLFIRAGYGYKLHSTSTEGEDAERFSFGAGIRFPLGRRIMSIDYAMADLNDLGTVGRFSAEFRF